MPQDAEHVHVARHQVLARVAVPVSVPVLVPAPAALLPARRLTPAVASLLLRPAPVLPLLSPAALVPVVQCVGGPLVPGGAPRLILLHKGIFSAGYFVP